MPSRGPMSTSSVSVVQPARSTTSPTRDPLAAHLLTIGVAGLLTLLLVRDHEQLLRSFTFDWPELAFWTALVMFLNLVPINVKALRLTLDVPILLAIAFLYSPSVGAAVALLGAFDPREIKREISLSRAIFNRAQIALGTMMAGWTFHAIATGFDPWAPAIVGTAAALAVEYCANVSLVFIYLTLASGARERISHFSIGRPLEFLTTYLGNGTLALVVAQLFARGGAWSVVIFVAPILVARQALVRAQQLQELAVSLQSRERLMERLVDRAVDERRDERLRIAGDLHDDVLQDLTRSWYLMKIVQKKAARHSTEESSELQELVESSESSIESLREVVHDLRESPLGRGGLVPTLRLLVRDLQLDWRSSIRLFVPDQVSLSAQSQVIAYQIAREGIINALKHAKATEIRVTISQGGEYLRLAVEDDGIGFDYDDIDQRSHFGIGLMQERARRAKGELAIESQQGNGTRLVTILPLELSPSTG